jgi:ArsR family transcriptional regulator
MNSSNKIDLKTRGFVALRIELPIIEQNGAKPQSQASAVPDDSFFETYEAMFKALADKKRLQIMHVLTQRGRTCVCDLSDIVGMAQSKLSYHLKILLDAGLIHKDAQGTWSYYELETAAINGLLSEELCCVFRPNGCC